MPHADVGSRFAFSVSLGGPRVSVGNANGRAGKPRAAAPRDAAQFRLNVKSHLETSSSPT